MRRLTLVAVGLVLGLVACEVALRLVTAAGGVPVTPLRIEHGRWTAHPFLPFAGIPAAEYRLNDRTEQGELRFEHIKNNAYGFRSHEFPPGRGERDVYIVCLGGSTTYGRRVESNASTWPELLERRLAERYPDRHFTVFNLGIDRATSAVSVVNMALVAAHLDPHLVIVYQGYNDSAAMGARDYRTDHAHFYSDFDPARVWRGVQRSLPGWLAWSYAANRAAHALDRLLELNDLAAEVGKPRLESDDPYAGMDTMLGNLTTIRSIAEGAGARTLFSTFQFRDGDDPLHAGFNRHLREFFEGRGYDFVDQARLLPDRDPTINTDVCHFTPKGREMLADNFFQHIVEHGLVEEEVAGSRSLAW